MSAGSMQEDEMRGRTGSTNRHEGERAASEVVFLAGGPIAP